MQAKEFEQKLLQLTKKIELSVNPAQVKSLQYFMDELLRWNKSFNISAIREEEGFLQRNIVDSLTMVPHICNQERVIDVGTGGGLPGLVLAIMCKGAHFTLLDGQQKRIHFVQHIVNELGLTNVLAVHERAESYQPDASFDIITSRAFTQLDKFCQLTSHLLAPGGRWVAMKGAISEGELNIVSAQYEVFDVKRFYLPGSIEQRSLVFIRLK